MKKIVIAVLLVMAAAGGALYVFKENKTEAKWRTEAAVRGDIVESVTATGTLNATTTILVGTQVSGTVKRLLVDFNSPVKKGQVIAQIDPAAFEAQVEQAKANLLSARANLEKARATGIDTKRTYERNKDLFSRNLVAKSDLDTAQTNHDSAVAQVSAAQAQIAQAEAALRLAQTNLAYTDIISPVDGVVISRNVDVGQTVAASFQTPTLFVIAQDLTKMQIDSNVNEADIGNIRAGQDVEFTVDAYPEKTFSGNVIQVRNSPIVVQNVVTYDVVITVDNTGLKLKPGMTANVSLITARKTGVVKVPNAALRFKLPEGAAPGKPRPKAQQGGTPGASVWVLDGGKPVKVKITTGISDGSYTEVASGEIKEGQQLIVESLSKPNSSARGIRIF